MPVLAEAGAGPGGSSSLEWPGPLPQQQVVAGLSSSNQNAEVRACNTSRYLLLRCSVEWEVVS
jgi:hypothetical protein